MQKKLTKEGLEKIKKELTYLETVKRREVAEKMKHAVSLGDLSENAEYDSAREEMGFTEKKIKELKEIVAQATIIEKSNSGKVEIGSVVLVSVKGKEDEYQIVSPEESDIASNKLSFQSPFGKILLGKREGDKVILENPKGKVEYQVIKIN